MVPLDRYLWQQLLKPEKADSKYLPKEAYGLYMYLKGLCEWTLIAALIGAYRDCSQEWFHAFKEAFLNDWIDPDNTTQNRGVSLDELSEIRYWREVCENLPAPTKRTEYHQLTIIWE